MSKKKLIVHKMRRKKDLSGKPRADRGKQVTPPPPLPLLSFQLKVNDEGIQQKNTDQEMWMYVEDYEQIQNFKILCNLNLKRTRFMIYCQ